MSNSKVRKVLHNKTFKITIVAMLAILSITAAGNSVFATLDATASNTVPTNISSGNLKLIVADNGAGFATAITNIAPGDVLNRYVSYQNSGTMDAQGLTLAVTDSGSSLLTTDATKGLQVAVSSCSVAWTPSTGICSGSTSALLASTSLLGLKTTPGSILSGTLTAGAFEYLKFSISFPSATETTVNGVLPDSTVQGLSASITWTLRETQRTATNTNS